MSDIAFQAVYEIIALAVPITDSVRGMSCAIMDVSCTVLTCFGPVTLGF